MNQLVHWSGEHEIPVNDTDTGDPEASRSQRRTLT